MSDENIRAIRLDGGIKGVESWGPFGPLPVSSRNLPPQLKQMQPTGTHDEQGDEGRLRALEAATVARAEGGDWGSFVQYLRESPAAGPLNSEERFRLEGLRSCNTSDNRNIGNCKSPVPFDASFTEASASTVYEAENFPRILRAHPGLKVRRIVGRSLGYSSEEEVVGHAVWGASQGDLILRPWLNPIPLPPFLNQRWMRCKPRWQSAG